MTAAVFDIVAYLFKAEMWGARETDVASERL
jgi:hypothetical protein